MDTYGSLLLRAQHALGSLLGSLDSISGLVLPGVRTIGVDIGGLSHNWDLLVSGQLIGGNDREQGEGEDLKGRAQSEKKCVSPRVFIPREAEASAAPSK